MTCLILVIASADAIAEENPSNPLAAVNNTDVRVQYMDLDGAYIIDTWLDGAYMLNPKVKLKYEVHHWTSDLTGTRQNNFESLHLKAIWFPSQGGEWGSWKYKPSIGLEWIKGWGNDDYVLGDRSIGSSADQLGPFVGLSFVKGATVLVPLVQHYFSYDGPDVNMTATRLIAIQSLPNNFWGKLDLRIPIDWENDKAIPATAEAQLGKMFSPSFGTYVDLMVGVGTDRPYDWGLGIGVRMTY